MSPHTIGLMPGVPVPRLVSMCNGNGEAWFEVLIQDWRFICWGEARAKVYIGIDAEGKECAPGCVRYSTRPEALEAIRAYIHRTSAEKHFVLAEEAIDRVPEAV